MENERIEKTSYILKSLGSSHCKQSIYHNLSQLRKIVTNKKQFIVLLNHDGIRILIGCLVEKNSNIIDLSLSILGNCCVEQRCAKEVVKHSGLQILVDILKNSSSDTIICRACRLIGNIAKFDNYASEIYKYGIVPIVIRILNTSISEDSVYCKQEMNKLYNKISMATHTMAVRVLRLLWESCSNRPNMIEDGTVKVVSLLLIHYTGRWCAKQCIELIKKQTEKLLEDILKCLLLFSKLGTLECAQQVLANGNGFKTLVSLINLNPYLAVKCLTNLSHVATSRSDMANAAAVTSVVTKIREHIENNPNERCSYDIVYAFCLLCKHPMNCTEVKRAGGLQLILKLLKYCRSTKQEYQIVNALSYFHCDEESQEILFSNGVIEIIIDCIERNLKSKNELNEKHSFVEKRTTTNIEENITVVEKQSKRRVISTAEQCFSTPKKRCISDSFSCANGNMTPTASDTFSADCIPSKKEYVMDDYYNSANCSYVCNERKTYDSNSKETSLKLQNDAKDKSHFESSDPVNDKSHFDTSDFQEKTIIMMIVVLSRISHMKPTSPDMGLGSKRSLIILLKCVRESRFPQGRITSLLIKIVRNPDYLLYMIETDTIQLIHNLTDTQHDLDCNLCSRMKNIGQSLLNNISRIAESEPGKGLLYNLMQNGNLEEKIKCLINIPLIVQCKPMLIKFMDTWKGLNILINQFTENLDTRYLITVALNNLACCANVNNPVTSQNSPLVSSLSDRYNSERKNITIKLDDGSMLDTDKEFLIENANYFKVMLTGAFKESNQGIIRLTNVSNKALQCLLNLLQGDFKKFPPHKLEVDLSTILEVIILTDIYLLENLTNWLTSCVEQYSLTVDTACEIYIWSVKSGTNYLRIETVAFILTANMKPKERYNIFENIIEYGLIIEIKDDIQKLISRYLKIQ